MYLKTSAFKGGLKRPIIKSLHLVWAFHSIQNYNQRITRYHLFDYLFICLLIHMIQDSQLREVVRQLTQSPEKRKVILTDLYRLHCEGMQTHSLFDVCFW